MKITNTDGIEQCLLNAISNSNAEYERKKGLFLAQHEHDIEISVTTLAQPPQAVELKRRHWDEIVLDGRRAYYKVLGDLMHKVAESYALPGDVVEERYGRVLNARIKGRDLKVLVHGAADRSNIVYQPGYIKDYKYTSMVAMNYEKSDYVQQLNLLRYLREPDERELITQLSNIFVFRDFRWQDALTGRSKQPTWTKEIFYDIWPDEQCKEVLRLRLMAHLQAKYLPDEQLPDCTREELWFTQSGYRVRHKTKKGEWSKLASGWSADHDEALLLTKKKDADWRIEPTEGKPKRCEWCDAASVGCKQFLAMQATQQPNTDDEDDND